MLRLFRRRDFLFPQRPLLSSATQPQRSFFFGSGKKNDDPQQPKDPGSALAIPQTGENAPRLGTLLGLPVRRPIFPGLMSAAIVKDERTIEAIIRSENAGISYLGTFLRTDVKDGSVNEGPPELITRSDQIHKVGTFVQIQSIIRLEQGLQLLLMGHRRINLEEILNYGPPLSVRVNHWKKPVLVESTALKAYRNELLLAVRELFKLNPLAQEHSAQWLSRIELSDSFKLADVAAAITTADANELQGVLEATDPEERLSKALELVTKEKEVAKLQMEINRQVEEKISKSQREYFLREQLKSIKKELGVERDDKDEMMTKFAEKVTEIETRNVDEKIIKVLKDEMQKLGSLERNSPEFNVTRSYLEWLLAVPWNVVNKDRLDLAIAKETLDLEHYGLDDIKKRILEFIAVGKLRGTVAGKIVCFIGPPGVGKTSIAKSIATALNRSFYRFSVGGLTDIAEIKGHRRTYIGAMPGKPIQSLKSTGCSNPLILIDEIDKLGRGHNGDPASALLELLDPNQNSSFVDHYLDVPVPFNNVLFVCTANDESTIPGPLKDRMEIFRLSGYDIPEKVAIARKYLVPKAFADAGLEGTPGFSATITDEALDALVRNYCRESGVRSLEKQIEKIARKIAFGAVTKQEAAGAGEGLPSDTIVVTAENLEEFVGKARFTQDTIYDSGSESLPVGVVMGLAWNPLGGSPVFIETAAIPVAASEGGGGVNVITGQLGSVMKESVNIAYTFARQFVALRNPDNNFFKGHQLHLHVPEGAVEKDGPSAGIAMTCSLISIAINRLLKPRVAMTGELSLTGKVLPIGGVKEKTLAARRSGADTVILPAANKRDYDELPQYVKDCVKVHFVGDYKEVYDIVFPS